MQQDLSGDLVLRPPKIVTDPGPEYADAARRWQGIPGIERAANGRLWAVWYSGGDGEGPYNFVLLVTSGDDGQTWSPPVLVIDPPAEVRAFDPCLWCDPLGRMWLCWAQSDGFYDGRAGVWAIRCDDPGTASPTWTAPRRLTHGIMMNKPTVLATGEWLFPTAVWAREPHRPELAAERRSNVLCTADQGETFTLLGGADVPNRSFDEHMVVERHDGSLWMLVRTHTGVGDSISTDRGRTWTAGREQVLPGPCSRFFIRRLHSGRLLLVNHHNFTKRNNLTAFLSDDDGQTWQGGLLLDGRDQVSYPDGTQAEDGRLYVIYDRERYGEKEILLAVFTEDDVLAGRPVSDAARLRVVVNRIGSSPCP